MLLHNIELLVFMLVNLEGEVMNKTILIPSVIFLFLSSFASADLMKEPLWALKGNKHAQYSSMHEKITDCEQRSDGRWRLRKYPIKLRRYNFQLEFNPPFSNRDGKSCMAGFAQRFNGNITINTKMPPIIDVKGGGEYGHTDDDRSVALYWWAIATSHAVYNPSSKASKIVRNTLLDWAFSNALSKNIYASYGSRPLEYEVIVLISRIVETVAALGSSITREERQVLGPWLDGLVRKVQKSTWLSRQDNKQYLVDYTLTLWAVINGDTKVIEKLALNYKHAIHDMRVDGSIVQESVRGGSSLQYQAIATQVLVKQAALIKNLTQVDIAEYKAEGNRELSDAIKYVIAGHKNPKVYTQKYGKLCAASFGSLEKPNLHWRRYALKPLLEYANYEHQPFGLNFSESQVPGQSEYASSGNIKCMFTE